ncbi:Protein of unknown function [Bizionia echini]|uniref:DUF2490 domain-containing protein n=1 Tax=Bizionia echini TaxID=649333 RepID=A0A1I4ZY66_9FLAO|nr:DUF2490 domain-containing protein [Bizionia echini]SFN55127.1 Protein of unknown function [Bizionia echini]
MKPSILFILTCIFSLYTVQAQDSLVNQDIKVNSQLWLDYNFAHSVFNAKKLQTQVSFRKIFPEAFNRFVVMSALEIPHEKSLSFLNLEKPVVQSFHLGTGLFYTQNFDAKDNLEFRLFQGFKFDIPTIKSITLNNYVRLEERFQNNFNNSGWTSGFRLRYRLSTILEYNKHLTDFVDGFYIPLSAEVFFNLKKSDRYNDLIRLEPGLGYKLKNNWKFEVYLIFNETKNNTATNNSSSDFILRLRVFDGNIVTASKKNQINKHKDLQNN